MIFAGIPTAVALAGTLLKTTAKERNADDPFRQSAVVAYYAVFSMPALLVVIIAIA